MPSSDEAPSDSGARDQSSIPDTLPRSTPDGRYVFGSILGGGGHGLVFLARDTETQQLVAVKLAQNKRIAQTLREIKALQTLTHPSIIKLIAASMNPERTSTFVILELCTGGELFHKIVQSPRGRFADRVAQYYFASLIDGVKFMHEKGYAHRDIKPENLLLTENYELRITDFGLAKRSIYNSGPRGSGSDGGDGSTTAVADLTKTFCGSMSYMAPEVCSCVWVPAPYDPKKADIWSCGVLLYVMLVGKLPWKRALPVDPGFHSLQRGTFQYPDHISEGAKRVLQACLAIQPSDRCSASELLQMPWMLQAAHVAAPVSEMRVLSRTVSGLAAERPTSAELAFHGWISVHNTDSTEEPMQAETTPDPEDAIEPDAKRRRVDVSAESQIGETKTANSAAEQQHVRVPETGQPECQVGRAICSLGWHAIQYDRSTVCDKILAALRSLKLHACINDSGVQDQTEILVLCRSAKLLDGNSKMTEPSHQVGFTKADEIRSLKEGTLVCKVTVHKETKDGKQSHIHFHRSQGGVLEFHDLYKKLRSLLSTINHGAA